MYQSIEEYKKKYPDENNVPRPKHWSGWCLNPNKIEFWLDGEDRIHQRLKYKEITIRLGKVFVKSLKDLSKLKDVKP